MPKYFLDLGSENLLGRAKITWKEVVPARVPAPTPIPIPTPTPTPIPPSQWNKLGSWEVGCDNTVNIGPIQARQMKFQMSSGGGGDRHISFYCCGSGGAAWLVDGSWQHVTRRSEALDVGEWREASDFGGLRTINRQYFSVGCNDGERMNVDVYYYR